MTYLRLPNSKLPGRALSQTPAANGDAGILPLTLDADIATTTGLGVVQVGSGLSITPSGILSATGSSSSFINVTLTNVDYTVTATDYYIGATKKDIDVTLPLGIAGRVYVVKNQVNGNIKVKATGGQKIDTSSDKTLGSEASIIVVFDGSRWNVI
jgi:hypothetical protein